MNKSVHRKHSASKYSHNRRVDGFRARACLQASMLMTMGAVSGILHAGECVAYPTSNCNVAGTCSEQEGMNPSALPRLTLSNFDYVGAFKFSGIQYGESSLNFASPIIEQAGNSLFIAGHDHHDAIAEFVMPELVDSTNLADLNIAGAPVQSFTRVLRRAPSENLEGIDQITGMEIINGKMIINGVRYYDGNADNTDTTLVLDEPANLSGSPVEGFLHMQGAARSAGWISPVPDAWQSAIGAPYITGNSSATPIISRHSVGPSAHALNPDSIFAASVSSPEIETTRLMEFGVREPLHSDLYNESGSNDLWTHKTGAWYGFIVPGTRTYATFGHLAGITSGIGYKIRQDLGKLCGGYCSHEADDEYPYYWLFDVNDLLKVKRGELSAGSLRPYEYGKFPAPFQPNIGAHGIRGGTFDEESGTLYLSLRNANQVRLRVTPVIIAYRFPTI